MMKHLSILLFSMTLISCAPMVEKIADRTGCVNGVCTNGGQTKPQACSKASSTKITSFQNSKFETVVEKVEGGTLLHKEFVFGNNNATLTQYCESETASVSPYVTSGFNWSPSFKRLQFTEPKIQERAFGGKVCKAELTGENFTVSFEGTCLVLENAKGEKSYYERK